MDSRATWRKSSRSPQNQSCVEVAGLGDRVAVRDSKIPDGPILVFEPSEWATFLAATREGRYNLG